ncbi:MAG: hypothetical protein EXQ60_05810 [Candidatus Nanopelagicales bacterium]|nr:hypothetical protein [Candidatus Nanopelagicales bacterium]
MSVTVVAKASSWQLDYLWLRNAVKGAEAVRLDRSGSRYRTWLTALVAVICVGFGSIALAAPAAARDLGEVREQVFELEAKAESAHERFNDAQARLNEIDDALATLKNKIAVERRELNAISGAVDDLARATYTGGGVDPSLQVLLAEDPAQFLAQASALDQVAKGQADALRASQTARLRLAQSEAALQQKEAAAREVRAEMADAKREAFDRLTEAEAILNSLEAAERQRLSAMAASERQASLAAAAAAAQALNSSSTSGGGYSISSRAIAAVRYGLSQVGDRYVAAATGPSSFDCSGLTMSAWRQGGVSLPHYSYSQYQKANKIPLSQAQPGDLVFYFGGSVHHVGLYIGNGQMVHAANPRDGVVVTNVLAPWYARHFTGIGRVVG